MKELLSKEIAKANVMAHSVQHGACFTVLLIDMVASNTAELRIRSSQFQVHHSQQTEALKASGYWCTSNYAQILTGLIFIYTCSSMNI